MPPDHPSSALPDLVSSAATGLLSFGVRAYQVAISPTLHAVAGPGCGCRFTPTCSHYALEALALHGPVRGTVLGARRLLRCHPWGPHGLDPVPARREVPPSAPSSSLSA